MQVVFLQDVRHHLAAHRLRIAGSGPHPASAYRHPVVLLGELCPLRGQALLHLLLLGHRLQGTLRVGRGGLQAYVLQCHAQQLQDVDSDRVRRDCPVRVHQEANRPDPPAARTVLHAAAFPALDIFALLRLVGVHKLLQR